MLQIQTLENTGIEKILQVFNESFADYLVPFRLSREQLAGKIQNEGILLKFSVGVFDDQHLVAFILHGYDASDKTLYNAGTGVLPAYRGQHLTRRMYAFILPLLPQEQVSKITLEVITENMPAFKTYQAIGFEVTRLLNCYKGSLTFSRLVPSFAVLPLREYDWDSLQSFWDWQPAWQNSITAVENLKNQARAFGIYENGKILGYIIFNTAGKRVQQFAVHKSYRHRGIGQQLFKQVASGFGSQISIINVDGAAVDTNKFLTTAGLEIFTRQYEMEMKLNA